MGPGLNWSVSEGCPSFLSLFVLYINIEIGKNRC